MPQLRSDLEALVRIPSVSVQLEEDFRALGTVLDGVPLIGTGGLGSRVWSGPAVTVMGIDVPSVDGAVNAVSPNAKAMLNGKLALRPAVRRPLLVSVFLVPVIWARGMQAVEALAERPPAQVLARPGRGVRELRH